MRPFYIFLISLSFSFYQCQNSIESDEKASYSVEKGSIELDSVNFEYVIEGEGIPCLVIGSSVYYPRTFSKKLRKHFRFYFVDLRWFTKGEQKQNLEEYTIDSLTQEIDLIRQALNLENPILLGHSIHGTIAFEYAKRYPDNISSVVMIGSPSIWGNRVYENATAALWDGASRDRKSLQYLKWGAMKDSITKMPANDQMVANYVNNGPRYWYDMRYDAAWLWEDMPIKIDVVNHLFGTIFADYYMFKEDFKLELPVLLFLGKFDYVVPYTLWEKQYEQSPDFTTVLLSKSGHTPQLEEPENFDKAFLEWAKTQN